MEDIVVNNDDDIQTINLDLSNGNDSDLLGIELLTDPDKKTPTQSPKASEGVPSPKADIELNTTPPDHLDHLSNPDPLPMEDINLSLGEGDFNGIVDTFEKTESKSIPVDDPLLTTEHKPNPEIQEFKPIHTMSSQDIKNEKIDLIYKFKRLDSQGIRTTMNYNMVSPLEDMRNEFIKLKKQREIDNSIKFFSRKALMACVTGIEFLNTRFDPFSIHLEGWSENVNENINDYDEIFEELSQKYTGGGESEPEMKLLFALGGSAFMFHLQNTLFKTSLPGMSDIMKQNPELAKQFAEAAMNDRTRNARGPAGPMGPMGPAGPTGPTRTNRPSSTEAGYEWCR